MLGSKLLLSALALGLASALPSTLGKRAFADCNTPSTRSQWCGGMNITTDSEILYPPGGQIREYNLVVSAGRLAPDGNETDVLMINGSIPGPTLYADWGDTFVINVFNNMTDNGTSMHWHGVIQANTTLMDGVNGITECPIAPGRNKTYTFVATQHGTSWYHSHYSGQYGEGVLGALVVNGPASANYDDDLGPMTISDWFYESIYDRELYAEDTANAPPVGDSALINGSMRVESASIGSYFTTKPLAANTTYRLRLINTAVDNGYQVSLDNHNLTVIAADFVPVNATSTEWLFIGIGQRYDVLFTTGSTPGNFWFRAEIPNPFFSFRPTPDSDPIRLPGLCGANKLANPGNFSVEIESNIKAIFHYAGAPTGNPNTTRRNPPPNLCEENSGLTPVLTKSVPSSEFVFNSSNEFNVNSVPGTAPDGRTINTWTINESAVTVDWELPTLGYIRNGTSDQLTDSEHTGLNVYRLPEANKFYFWVIQNDLFRAPVPHPIHLHGHDFFVLGSGPGHFNGSQTADLNFANPMRRDVQMLPGWGWLVIAIHTNNPGVWLMHCHIAWHISMGLGVQFVERESELHTPEMNAGIDRMQEQCVEFDQWYDSTEFKRPDGGLRGRPGQPPRVPPRPSTPLLKGRNLKV